MKPLVFTVTNDLVYDQRMQRICSSLAVAGYDVLLVGRLLKNSPALSGQPYKQKRLCCFFNTGIFFYAEYNIRLFLYLLFIKTALICAIDLDTIIPVWLASVIKKTGRVYDAHELFTEQKEIVTRPLIHRVWLRIEKIFVPRFRHGYTVNQFIAEELSRRYGVRYSIIRNLPLLEEENSVLLKERFLIYQGAVNEGRSFETLIPAMQQIDIPLHIYGDGNYFAQTEALIKQYRLENKVILKGKILPEQLKKITPKAYAAIMLFENNGLNQYQSLANRFFDYIMAGVPQLCVDYPEYKRINDQYQIAVTIPDTRIESIVKGLQKLLQDNRLYEQLQKNCVISRGELNWQVEEKILLEFYNSCSDQNQSC